MLATNTHSVCVAINGKLLPEITMIWNVRETREKSEQKILTLGGVLLYVSIDWYCRYLWALLYE